MNDADESSVEVSIVIPCLNEAETLRSCITKAQQFLEECDVQGEIVVADNGSTDGSPLIVQGPGVRTVNVPVRGYGSAIMGGIAASRGKYIIMGDADDSYDFLSLKPFLDKLRNGCDLVMGNRFRGTIKPGAMPWLHRYVGNPLLSRIGRLFFKSPLGDFHCGLRGFHKDAILKLDLKTTGMEFASEMVVKATLQGLHLAEVPITLYRDGRSRRSHVRTWRDGWRHLRFLLLFSPRWLFLYPGLILIAIGLSVGIWLIPGPRRIANVVFDVHTLLFAGAALIVGYQAVSFAFFTKVFAVREGIHPPEPWITNLTRSIPLELGLVVGVLLVLAGLAGSLYAFLTWGGLSFGPLDPSKTLRLVIPSVVLMILGCQTSLATFFLSILQLGQIK